MSRSASTCRSPTARRGRGTRRADVSETSSTATTPPEKTLVTLSRTISDTRGIVESIPDLRGLKAMALTTSATASIVACSNGGDRSPAEDHEAERHAAAGVKLIERLGVGTAIPSERQLSVDLGVSRLYRSRCARRSRRRGSPLALLRGSGTAHVEVPKITQQLTMTSFSEDMRRRGMAPGSTTLSLHAPARGAATRPLPQRLSRRRGRSRQAA